MTITSCDRIELAQRRREHALARARQEEPPLPCEYETPLPAREPTLFDLYAASKPKPTKPNNRPKFSNTRPRII